MSGVGEKECGDVAMDYASFIRRASGACSYPGVVGESVFAQRQEVALAEIQVRDVR